jgi:YesN/AraC family two-component response regulator
MNHARGYPHLILTRLNRILVIEDTPDLADLICEHLQECGLDVHLNRGEEVGIGDVMLIKPDLVLVDWMLPAIEGIHLIRQIKASEATRHIPCILMTGRTSDTDAITVYETGADSYLGKPFSMEMLSAVIQNLDKRLGSSVSMQSARKHTSLIDEFHQLVEARYADPDLNLEVICTHFHCTRHSLIQRIRKLTGVTPYSYIKTYRLQRARDLLLTGKYFVTDVAFMVGYHDLAVFSKMFKIEFGVSPKQISNSARSRRA